jgi:hypothetical protein
VLQLSLSWARPSGRRQAGFVHAAFHAAADQPADYGGRGRRHHQAVPWRLGYRRPSVASRSTSLGSSSRRCSRASRRILTKERLLSSRSCQKGSRLLFCQTSPQFGSYARARGRTCGASVCVHPRPRRSGRPLRRSAVDRLPSSCFQASTCH